MMLNFEGDSVGVYGLCGTYFPVSDEEIILNPSVNRLYPNPVKNGSVTLEYSLPKGESTGEILLFNSAGALVNTYKIGYSFKKININTSELNSGNYYYLIKSSKGIGETKKMIVIN